MEWYWWMMIIVMGSFIAFQVFQYVIGAGLKVGDAARLYLSAELKKHGVRQLIPDQAVWDVADEVANTFQMMGKMDNKGPMWVKTEMLPILDSQAKLIVCWLRGDQEIRKFKTLAATMERYGVPCGSHTRKP